MPDPNALRVRLEAACDTPAFPAQLSFKAMFGGLTGYADERNFASLSDVGLAFKLAPNDIAALVALGGAMLRYEPNMPASKTSVVVPARVLDDDDALRDWAIRSARHVATLPLKKKKPKS